MERKTLIADEGMIYTNGESVYGYILHLAEGIDETSFYQIAVEEYEELMKAEEPTMLEF